MNCLFDLGISLCKGLLLSGSVYILGTLLDNTISKNSKEIISKENESLLREGETHIQNNLLIISPIVYFIVDQTILVHTLSFSFVDFTVLILCQNIGYYFAHREMHRNRKLYFFHAFHHKFDKIVLPSTGNAVTYIEFLFAYICPIVGGAFICNPSEITFMSSIGLISVLNLCIHTYEFNKLWWVPGLVSPTNHIEHHLKKDKHYAAPLIDIDKIESYIFVN
jgi:sterol desaturase/sphingolipid hydroxylase (fatty acid hydroxylase superfamily)